MALVIHRRGPTPDIGVPLLLLGGDGRWAKPLLRLLEALGLTAIWTERWQGALAGLDERQIIIVGDSATARSIVEHRKASEPPIVVLTGSLHGLSTAVRARTVPLSKPVTRDELEEVLVSIVG